MSSDKIKVERGKQVQSDILFAYPSSGCCCFHGIGVVVALDNLLEVGHNCDKNEELNRNELSNEKKQFIKWKDCLISLCVHVSYFVFGYRWCHLKILSKCWDVNVGIGE